MQPHYTPKSNPIPETSGIYRITCTVTEKFYIGSAINLHRRRKRHFTDLRNSAHDNPKLQRAWDKYGENAFTFEVVEFVPIPSLIEREQHWLDKTQAVEKGFNLAPTANSNFGIKYSPEAVEKSKMARTGKKRTPEQCENIGASRRGKPSTRIGYKASPETLERQRISHLGKKQSEETVRLRTEKLKGRKRDPEAVEKTRLKNLGRVNSPEARARMGVANIGRKHAPEVYTSRMKDYIVIAPDGTEHFIHGLGKFCREHNLNSSNLIQVAKGNVPHHKGWKARYAD